MNKPQTFKLKRRINAGSVTSKATQDKANVERYFDKLIVGNPHFKKITEAMKEGNTLQEIARWFVQEGWVTVSESSFYRALRDFRNRHPEVMYGEEEDLDALINSNRPNVDALAELNRILRLQKKRLYIDFNNEKSINKLFHTMNDEVKETREIITTIAKIQGKMGVDNNQASATGTVYTPEVRDGLRAIKVNEQSREQLRHLTDTFIKSFKNAPTSEETNNQA